MVRVQYAVRKWLLRMGASRTKQVSTRVHDGRLKRITGRVLKGAPQFLGRAERGATVADVCLPGAAEEKVEIFCLPRFVEDRGQSAAVLPSCAYAERIPTRGMGTKADPFFPSENSIKTPYLSHLGSSAMFKVLG